MSKREFLAKLKELLEYELPESIVREKINFYDDYIDQEVAGGKRVSEVIDDLGDPMLIAKSIIDAAESGPDGIPGTGDDIRYTGEIYGNSGSSSQRGSYGGNSNGYGSGNYSGSGSGSYTGADSGSYGGGTSTGSDYGSSSNNSGTRFGGGFGNGGMQFYNIGCFGLVLIMLVIFSIISVAGLLLGVLSPILAPICIVALIIWLLNQTTRGGGR